MPEDAPVDGKDLLRRIERLEEKLAATETELKAAKIELARKDQIIAGLQKRLFGSSSERINPNQLEFEFGEALLGKPEPLPQPGSGEEKDKGAKGKRKRRRKPDLFPKNLPVVISDVIVPDEVKADPDGFVEIGEEYHDELEAVPPQLYWDRKVRKKVRSKTDREQPPLLPPAPEPTLPGTLCGPNLMAQILVDKYEDHLPHYRQSKRFLRKHEVELGRQTINGWTHAAANHLAPIGEAIKSELSKAEVLQIDESPGNYLDPGHGKTNQGYMWFYRDPEKRTVYCDWQLRREHQAMFDILGIDAQSGTASFSGIIQCDGYSAYTALINRFSGIRLGGCLAHIRRKFYDALDQAPQVVKPILWNIQLLYGIERGLQQSNAPPECRKLVRQANSLPIFDSLRKEILTQRRNHLPQSKLGEAITYAMGQFDEFAVYFEDGRVEIDNNRIENAIRPAKLGLKNYLFFGNADAGKASALFYTLLGNCKAQGIDPERYLAEAIKCLPANATLEQAVELTPAALAPVLRSTPASRIDLNREAAAA